MLTIVGCREFVDHFEARIIPHIVNTTDVEKKFITQNAPTIRKDLFEGTELYHNGILPSEFKHLTNLCPTELLPQLTRVGATLVCFPSSYTHEVASRIPAI